MKKFFIIGFFVFSKALFSQDCKDQVVTDSVFKPSENKKVVAGILTCGLKNGGAVQFINQNGRFMLKIIANEKFGFEDKGSLELKSGTKSFFVKSTTLHDFKLPQPYFLVDILINYVGTLKDEGLTAIVFNKFEAKLAKEDTKIIKETADCFYAMNKPNKKK
jgi:hypothetical protein